MHALIIFLTQSLLQIHISIQYVCNTLYAINYTLFLTKETILQKVKTFRYKVLSIFLLNFQVHFSLTSFINFFIPQNRNLFKYALFFSLYL